MTQRAKNFTELQKLRILVNHGARALVGGEWAPIARVTFPMREAAKRLRHLNEIGCMVQCACGCTAWTMLKDIRFDHWQPVVFGGSNHSLSNGRPMAVRCHALKSADEHRANAKAKRIRAKHFGTEDAKAKGRWPRRRLCTRASWPKRTLPSRAFPQRIEA